MTMVAMTNMMLKLPATKTLVHGRNGFASTRKPCLDGREVVAQILHQLRVIFFTIPHLGVSRECKSRVSRAEAGRVV